MTPALNYSLPAEALLREERLSVPLFKCPDWMGLLEHVMTVAPCYAHCDLQAGQDQLECVDWNNLEQCLRLTDTSRVSVHMSPSTPEPHFEPDAMLERAMPDLERLITCFGRERVVIENAPTARVRAGAARTPLPALVVTRAVEALGCGLLLDLSHARIAATRLGVDVYAYVSSLPTHRLREVHVTGVQWFEGRLKDHLPMTDDDWFLFDWAMESIREKRWACPEVVALEYGGIGPKFEHWSDPLTIQSEFLRVSTTVFGVDRALSAGPGL